MRNAGLCRAPGTSITAGQSSTTQSNTQHHARILPGVTTAHSTTDGGRRVPICTAPTMQSLHVSRSGCTCQAHTSRQRSAGHTLLQLLHQQRKRPLLDPLNQGVLPGLQVLIAPPLHSQQTSSAAQWSLVVPPPKQAAPAGQVPWERWSNKHVEPRLSVFTHASFMKRHDYI